MRSTIDAKRAAALVMPALTLGVALATSCGELGDERHDLTGPDAERRAANLRVGDEMTENLPRAIPCSLAGDGMRGPVLHGRWGEDNWCCGQAKCINRETCGADYGKYGWRCADCAYYDCSYRPHVLDPEPACHWQPPPPDGPRRLPP